MKLYFDYFQDYETIDIFPNMPEYQDIKTLLGHAGRKLINVERVQNSRLWNMYCL